MIRSVAVLSFLLLGRDLHGQYVDLREGGRIRIQTVAHPKWRYAHFVSYDSSGLRLTRCDSCGIEHFELPELRGFQASIGHTGRSFALEGALLGAVIGGVWGRQTAVGATHRTSELDCVQRCAASAATVQGTLLGMVIGTTVGAFLRREHWVAMPLPDSGTEKR